MASPVISVSNLGKRYYLSHKKRTDTLRDSLTQKFRRLVGRAGPEGDAEEFWALRDVSFDINQGDVVGIIGRNGAGKSTLLKILSRITEPTSGQVTLRGRIASLLEVGTGFHPELSGRENIFLNGAILGMSRTEISRKFDEIVAFAEVERFLDTPVKHYSSGMYVRLAFAVAAHLEPEILIVDEVLAVGDVAFQNKCLRKIDEVATQDGRTVLLVSHNMDSVLRLCRSCIVLAQGKVVFTGAAAEGVARYAHAGNRQERVIDCQDLPRPAWAKGSLRVKRLAHLDASVPAWSVPFNRDLPLSCELGSPVRVPNPTVFLAVFSLSGVEVAATQSPVLALPAGKNDHTLACTFRNLRLTPGSYLVNIGVRSEGRMEDFIAEAVRLEVMPHAESIHLHTDSFRGFYVPTTDYRLG
jgi:lipopolysaccharide transport system ATP-binding protein